MATYTYTYLHGISAITLSDASTSTVSTSVGTTTTTFVVHGQPIDAGYHPDINGVLEAALFTVIGAACVYMAVRVRIDIARDTTRTPLSAPTSP